MTKTRMGEFERLNQSRVRVHAAEEVDAHTTVCGVDASFVLRVFCDVCWNIQDTYSGAQRLPFVRMDGLSQLAAKQ